MSESKENNLMIETPSIPQSHAEFANEVANIADKYGMDRFTMEYRPNFDQRIENSRFYSI